MKRSRSRSREREGRTERGRGGDRDRTKDSHSRRGRDRDDDRNRGRRNSSPSPPRRRFREDDDYGKDGTKNGRDFKIEAGETTKPSKQERRKAENAVKRQRMLEEERREKDKVKDRLDLVRQMKGDSGDEEPMGAGSSDDDEELTEEQQMMKLMGFAGFDSSKGKCASENSRGPAKGAISKHKKRVYRQYMNRRD